MSTVGAIITVWSCCNQEDSSYRVVSEVRSQLRVLETIDRVVSKRKQEQEHEQMLRAAKSRSKGADPEKAAKIREEAKQVSPALILISLHLQTSSLPSLPPSLSLPSCRSSRMRQPGFVMRVPTGRHWQP